MAVLVCTQGMTKGDEFQLTDGEITLGRSESNDVCVLDNMSSRTHCKIAVQGEELKVIDLGSTNGMLLNDEKVTGDNPLNLGDQIRIGYTIYEVRDSGTGGPGLKINSLLRPNKKSRVMPAVQQQKTRLVIPDPPTNY